MKRCGWFGAALIGLAADAAVAAAGAGAVRADEPLVNERLVAARLPAEIFAAADATLRNVWIEDEAGGRVPSVIEPVTRAQMRTVAGDPVLEEYPLHPHLRGVEDGWQVLDLAAGGVPLSAIVLATDDLLFGRRYTLHGLAPDGGKVVETPVAQGTLTQVVFQEVAVTNLALSFAARRFEVYRLRLALDGGPLPSVKVVRAEGPAWQVVAPMSPGRRYTLRAGGDAPTADGDTGESVVASLRAAGVGTVAGRVEGFVLETGGPKLFGRSQMFWMAMLAAGVVLLWCLLRVARRIN